MRRRRIRPLGAVTVLLIAAAVGCREAAQDAASPNDPTLAGEPAAPADTGTPADTGVRPAGSPDPAAPGTRAGAADHDPPSDVTESGPWQDARARGIDFRAVGQEPGWFLEIDDDRSILFAYDYGTERRTAPTPPPYHDQHSRRLTYRAVADSRELVIVIEDGPCFDTMSGEAFEKIVTVSFEAREYRGCGRVL
jgi:uncharacterized membrane protein